MVALFHFRANSHIEMLALVRNSWLFVDFFFVLSGFVIAANYQQRFVTRTISVRRFMWLRFARLYPLHLFMLALMVATEVLLLIVIPQIEGHPRQAFTGSRSLALIPENLLLLQSFGLTGLQSWNVPAWSISAELWTYLVFALAMVCSVWGRRFFWGVSLVVAPLAVVIWHGGELAMEFDGGIIRCLIGFGLGVALSGWYSKHGSRAPDVGWSEIPVFVLMLIFVINAPRLNLTLFAPIVFALVVVVFARAQGLISRFLSARLFVFLGVISYSIYMTHTYVHARLKNTAILGEEMTSVRFFVDQDRQLFGPSLWGGDLFVVTAVCFTVIMSYLTWKFVELPGQQWARRVAERPDRSVETIT